MPREQRLALYGIAAGAALAAGATQADATLITLDLSGLSASSRTTPISGNLYFDVNAASPAAAVGFASFAGADFRIQQFPNGTPVPPGASIFGLNPGNGIVGNESEIFIKASNLSASNHVGPDSSRNFRPHASITPFNSSWGPGTTGFLGLRFVIGADTNYGWANITANAGGTVTLNALGYETNPNTAVHVEAPSANGVPDRGSSLALLAIGAAGLLAFRRQQGKVA